MRLVNMKTVYCLFFLLGSVFAYTLKGQITKNIQFHNIQKTDGLPSNTVNKVIKDNLGFIWIATNDGLCRYDGPNQIEIFRTNPKNDQNSLASNNIRTLYADSKGNLWIGTRLGGLTRFHQPTNTWTTYRHQKNNPKSISNDEILTITEDSQHRLWIGTENGLNLFDYKTEIFVNLLAKEEDPNSLKTNAVLTVLEDDKGWIWVGTWAGGLHLLLTDGEEINANSAFKNIAPAPNKAAQNVWKVYQDRKNRYWIGTHGGGLFSMTLPINATNELNNQDWLPKFRNYIGNESDEFSLASSDIQDILEDNYGQLWIATGFGLSILDSASVSKAHYYKPNNQASIKFSSFYFDAIGGNGLPANNVMSILEDDQGLIWLGTLGGVSQYNWYTNQFDVFSIFDQSYKMPDAANLFIDDQEKAWIGAGKNGLLQYDLKDRTIHSFSNQYTHLFLDPYVYCIISPDQENLYIGSKKGVVIINKPNLTSKKFPLPDRLEGRFSEFFIHEIFVDKAGTVWLGSELGLYSLNPKNGVYNSYESDKNKVTSLSDNSVNSILEDDKGNLWVATYNGLNKGMKNKERELIFERFFHDSSKKNSITSNRITALSIIQDQLYIGTTAGLCSYDLKTGNFKDYSDNGHKYWIQSIVEGEEGNLWASTTEGIFFLDTKNKHFNFFEKKDGLGDLTFRLGAYGKDQKGCIYFGNRTGITRFYPDKIVGNRQPPPVFITNLRTVNPMGETLYNGIHRKEIFLNYNDYQLSLNFAALNYNRGEKNEYIYKLEGFDESWQLAKFGNPIVYTNLEPRQYTFRVKATNNDGVWNETGAAITIIKQPAFWQTWWFHLLSILVSGLLIILGLKFYTQNIRNRNLTLQSYNTKLNKEIEERSRIEKTLANREQFLRLIMDSVPQYIFWLDTEFRFQGGNKNLLKLLSMKSEEELIGKNGLELGLPKEHVEAQENFMKEVVSTQKPIFNYVYRTPEVQNFPKLWLEHNFIPLKDENKEIIGVLVSATNISKRVKSEQLALAHTKKLQEFNKELKRSNKDLEQFAYIASHDLKEPLRIIGNFSGLLARAYKTKLDQDAFEYINFIEDGVKRMSNLINSLLTYSRVGRKETKFRDINLNKLIDVKLFDLSKVIEERNAEIIVDSLPTIYGEREQIGMVFYNLINNAIKFNKQTKPKVHIKEEKAISKDYWQFAITDNGIGIDPQYQQQIFEIFRRLHGKQEYEGTGIGLSVCQKIVFRHEGKIWLESTLGKGTTFHFTISKDLTSKQLKYTEPTKTLTPTTA